MSYEEQLGMTTLTAAANLASSQYRILKMTSTGVDVATADTDTIIGVLQNKPGSGEPASVMYAGISRVVASAAVTTGAYLTATTGGKVVTTSTGGKTVIGIALQDAAADGDIIACRVNPITI